MKNVVFGFCVLACLLSCNSTPEVVVQDTLPTLSPTQPPEVRASNSPESSPASSASPTAPGASPSPNASASGTPDPTPTPEATAVPERVFSVLQGNFQNSAHKVSGKADILSVGPGYIARLEGFKTENGPNLHLYLVKDPQGSDKQGVVDLGALKGVAGEQNYELPSDVNPEEYKALTVWCVPFGVNFGYAPLNPTA